jgi:energy-coupling factor transporter ATP-binding protein EcfA2
LAGEHPEYLSAGQREWLALGRALSSDPEVLILDEPTKGLNQRERLDLVDRLVALQDRGKTVIVISHDWPLIGRATNNVLVMDHGRLVRQGPTREVLQDRDFFDQLGLPLPW